MERFRKLEVLGQGTYGKVYKALDLETNQTVALKKTILSNDDEGVPATTLREVSILRALSGSQHVVRLIDVVHTETRGGRPLLYLVFEYAESDLKQYMNRNRGRGRALPLPEAKHFCYQLLLGLHYCHARGVMHRDLKPQNLLVTDNNRTIKLADFGLGRSFCIPVGKYTHEVVTLWYRAPEILLGTRCYSTPVDIWSVGCIMLEMIKGRPVFCGESEIEQLFAIFRVLGTPTAESWPSVVDLRDWHEFPQWRPQDLRRLLPDLGEDGCTLLECMLRLDPGKRITAAAALQHPFFDDVRHEYLEATLACIPPPVKAVPSVSAVLAERYADKQRAQQHQPSATSRPSWSGAAIDTSLADEEEENRSGLDNTRYSEMLS